MNKATPLNSPSKPLATDDGTANSLPTAESPALSAALTREEKQKRFIDAMRGILATLTTSLDVDQVMQQILDTAATVVPSDAGSIIMLDGDAAQVAFLRGFPPESIQEVKGHIFSAKKSSLRGVQQGRTPYVISDTRLDSEWIAFKQTDWIRSSIGVPIALRDQVIGALIADSKNPNHFDPQDVENLRTLADYAALALEGAYHVTELEQKVIDRTTEQMEVTRILRAKLEEELLFQQSLKDLHEVTIELTQIDDIDTFYRRVVEFGRERMGFERLALFLYDPERRVAIGTYGTSADGETTDERHLTFAPAAGGMMEQAFNSANRFSFEPDAPLYQDLIEIDRGWNAAAALLNGTERIGWLTTDNRISHRPAPKTLLETLALYSRTLGTLLANKRTKDALHKSEANYRLLADNINDVVIRMSPIGIVTYASPSSLAVLGEPPEVLIQRSGFEYIHPEDLELLMSLFATALTQPAAAIRASYRYRHRDGRYIWLESNGQVVRSPVTGELQEIIVISRDISDRKLAENALRESLEREKELSRLKSGFVSMASHEFRTPLAIILSSTELVVQYRQKMTDEQIKERLGRVIEQVNYLTSIMDNMLDLSRMAAGRQEFRPTEFDLDGLCREIVEEFTSRPDVHHSVIYAPATAPLMVWLDRRLIRQAINNLITNAVKYSSEDKPIILTSTVAPVEIAISVQDFGIGIPEADIKNLFEPFHRGENVGNIYGTGLGLSIVKEAVELHNGSIDVNSELGVGTTFQVHIPLVKSLNSTEPYSA